ncbi:MAG: fibronectin type III domain-containing protein [Firmicutes bacterium]|jgi:hypothetical protein|nr:fibronectin type III domain-containing protein [Bacillota bacterium]NBI64542.1 hypothetical protein [Clostridiales bacterium]
MAENHIFQKQISHICTVSILVILFLLLIIASGSKAQAVEGNLAYDFTSTDDNTISTTANPNETTVLIFGDWPGTRSTLESLASCEWVKRPDIRVIFAETNRATKEQLQSYADVYGCQDITFCYNHAGDETFDAMLAYGTFFDIRIQKLPTIVLIDPNNQAQSLLQGEKTADELLAEIEKISDVGGEGSLTPPSDSAATIENYVYELQTIDNTPVSTRANPDETTVLVFGYTTGDSTKAALQSISGSTWVGRPDIRVIYADVYGASSSEVEEFAQDYSNHIIFCHDEEKLNWNHAVSYLGLYNQTSGKFPYIVLIDKNNKVRSITLGANTEDKIFEEIEKISNSGSGADDPGTSQDPDGTGTEQNPGSTLKQNVSNVSKLKASSTAKTVKLTWKKVANAKGYIIYQYDNTKKEWIKKATLKTNTASYTMKKLTPAKAYRFAVKAYAQSNGKQVESKSYASIYAATAPKAVNFKVKAGKKKATIKWKKVKGATGYRVYYKARGSWKRLKTTKGTSYTKKKLKSGTRYTFTVKAYKTYKGRTYMSSFKTKKVKVK